MRGAAPPPPVPTTPTTTGTATRPSAPPPPEGWRETSTTYPPGLHSLMHLDRVFVDHEPDGLEVLRTWDTERRYRVTDVAGTPLYTAIQESAPLARCCLGNCHAWDLHILDAKMQPASVPGGPPTRHREVLRVRRAMRCASCCFPCCLQKVTVHATGGELLGSVTQNWNAWRPSFTVRDAADVPVLLVKGPICRRCGGELDFLIKSIDKQHSVGVITKKWSGTAREFFGDGHSLGLGFPADLDAKIKAVLLGACFLVDFVYFEDQSSAKRNGKPRF